ncbi:MAG: hypothetical protein Q9162_006259 [Coniocarpon cinnabarinum]
MKFSTVFGGLSLLTLSSTAIAGAVLPSAAQAGAAALAKRAPVDDAYGIVSNLYTQIQTFTGSINSTAGSISPDSSQADKDAATSSVGEQLSSLTSAVDAATAQVNGLSAAGSDAKLMARESSATPDDLALLIEKLLLEISGALNKIIADLGLGRWSCRIDAFFHTNKCEVPLLAFLKPLVASLSKLLLALDKVVDQLLKLVKELVDGLLVGLSIGLAGLIL